MQPPLPSTYTSSNCFSTKSCAANPSRGSTALLTQGLNGVDGIIGSTLLELSNNVKFVGYRSHFLSGASPAGNHTSQSRLQEGRQDEQVTFTDT